MLNLDEGSHQMVSDDAAEDDCYRTNIEGLINQPLTVYTQDRTGVLNCLAVRLSVISRLLKKTTFRI